ncbi:DUF2911 domain-containing protein [Algoriphagus machipongonensis]|uniref:DUF2911 domain-containing protein n=1 Tax=Algoriphagus machipongonensis TaxID=388413 RepID=A3HTG0_9BACT|nr:DUF2911 domain-containing protein [Algoriphagus machipongonensis]EAZ83128.1 hypothetical protein ALPR1_12945 [Algoriphagus machipongonensis]
MKTFNCIVIAFGILFLSSQQLAAQQIEMPQASPAAKIAQKIGLTDVTVSYSRPSKKGRKIFGELVPYGSIWRTGANGATILDFSTDVNIHGKLVPKGQYALYSIPDKNSWTIILSKNTKLWGAIGYNPEEDLVRFNVEPGKTKNDYETFEITFNNLSDTGADLTMKWDHTQAAFHISMDPDPIVMDKIQKFVLDQETEDPGLLYEASNYYLRTGRDLNTAYQWIQESVDGDPKYWAYHLKAKIEVALGKNAEAIESAKESMELAEEAQNPDYVGLNERLIRSLK